MKIIKEGVPTQWCIRVTCTAEGNEGHGCGAVLEVEEADLKHTYMSNMGRFEKHYATFKCPCCGKHTDLQDDLPSKVWQTVLDQKIYVPDRDS